MNFRKYRPKQRIVSVISAIGVLLLAIVTILLANFGGNLIRERAVSNFNWGAQQVTNRLQATLNSYANNLYTGRSFLLNSPNVSQPEWAGYYRNQDVFNRYPGMSSIYFLQLVPNSQKASFEATMRKRPDRSPSYVITPPGDRDVYAQTTLLVSKTDTPASGFDSFSTPDRRAVYESAQETGLPTASTVYRFESGQDGLFLTLPVVRSGTTQGFIAISLRSADFFNTVIDPDSLGPISLEIVDVTDKAKPQQLYKTADWTSGTVELSKTDTILFGGRTWEVHYKALNSVTQASVIRIFPYLIMCIGLLLICVLLMGLFILFEVGPRSRHHHPKELE